MIVYIRKYIFTIFAVLIILPLTRSHSQHFIDEDILRKYNSDRKSFAIATPKDENKRVYIKGIYSKSNLVTNVSVGFDKLEYMTGDTIQLTIRRDNDFNFNGIKYNISIHQIGNHLRYEKNTMFELDQGEEKRVSLQLSLLPRPYSFIVSVEEQNSLQKQGITYELILEGELPEQFYVDQDIIREYRMSKKQFIHSISPENYSTKKVFLNHFSVRKDITNVMIGLNKTEYKKGEIVVLTFSTDDDEVYEDVVYDIIIYPGQTGKREIILRQGQTVRLEYKLPTDENEFLFWILVRNNGYEELNSESFWYGLTFHETKSFMREGSYNNQTLNAKQIEPHFIDEDIIRGYRKLRKTYFGGGKQTKSIALAFYSLQHKSGMGSDVYFGFDKTVYKRGEDLTLIIKRENDKQFENINYKVEFSFGSKKYSYIIGPGAEINVELPSIESSLSIDVYTSIFNKETFRYGFIFID